MRIKKVIGYDDLLEMQETVMEDEELCKDQELQNMLFAYCWQAIEYVDMMTEHGLRADFKRDSLIDLVPAIGIAYAEDSHWVDGDTYDERFCDIKEFFCGYVMFTLYNCHVLAGRDVRYELNGFETGLCLITPDGEDGEEYEFDVREALNRAFCTVKVEKEDCDELRHFVFNCNPMEFLKELLIG